MPGPGATATQIASTPREIVAHSRAPYRISTGGVDLEGVLREIGWGVATSVTIDLSTRMMVALRGRREGPPAMVSYRRGEERPAAIGQIRQDLMRGVLQIGGIPENMTAEMQFTGSMAAEESTGLGQSSSFIVAGLAAGHLAVDGREATPRQLAEEAIFIERRAAMIAAWRDLNIYERELVGNPYDTVGRQDPYASAFGGWNTFTFHAVDKNDLEHPNGVTTIKHIPFTKKELNRLDDMIVLIPTKTTGRVTDGVQREQVLAARERRDLVLAQRDASVALRDDLLAKKLHPEILGGHFEKGYDLKKLYSGMTNPSIERPHVIAKKKGSYGGRLVGGGNGGSFAEIIAPEYRSRFERDMTDAGYEPWDVHTTQLGAVAWLEKADLVNRRRL